jgi:hypothetical protein
MVLKRVKKRLDGGFTLATMIITNPKANLEQSRFVIDSFDMAE